MCPPNKFMVDCAPIHFIFLSSKPAGSIASYHTKAFYAEIIQYIHFIRLSWEKQALKASEPVQTHIFAIREEQTARADSATKLQGRTLDVKNNFLAGMAFSWKRYESMPD